MFWCWILRIFCWFLGWKTFYWFWGWTKYCSFLRITYELFVYCEGSQGLKWHHSELPKPRKTLFHFFNWTHTHWPSSRKVWSRSSIPVPPQDPSWLPACWAISSDRLKGWIFLSISFSMKWWLKWSFLWKKFWDLLHKTPCKGWAALWEENTDSTDADADDELLLLFVMIVLFLLFVLLYSFLLLFGCWTVEARPMVTSD